MGKLADIVGVMKVMVSSTREDWEMLDRKFYRLLFGLIGFAAMGLFWYFFLRNITPF